MLPASPEELVKSLLEKGPKDYLQSLVPEAESPMLDKILSAVDLAGHALPVQQVKVRGSSEEPGAPIASAEETRVPVASGWDSTSYLHRAANQRDDIWHKTTEDNLFQIVSKRITHHSILK